MRLMRLMRAAHLEKPSSRGLPWKAALSASDAIPREAREPREGSLVKQVCGRRIAAAVSIATIIVISAISFKASPLIFQLLPI
jgi:hypothetical protein